MPSAVHASVRGRIVPRASARPVKAAVIKLVVLLAVPVRGPTGSGQRKTAEQALGGLFTSRIAAIAAAYQAMGEPSALSLKPEARPDQVLLEARQQVGGDI